MEYESSKSTIKPVLSGAVLISCLSKSRNSFSFATETFTSGLAHPLLSKVSTVCLFCPPPVMNGHLKRTPQIRLTIIS